MGARLKGSQTLAHYPQPTDLNPNLCAATQQRIISHAAERDFHAFVNRLNRPEITRAGRIALAPTP